MSKLIQQPARQKQLKRFAHPIVWWASVKKKATTVCEVICCWPIVFTGCSWKRQAIGRDGVEVVGTHQPSHNKLHSNNNNKNNNKTYMCTIWHKTQDALVQVKSKTPGGRRLDGDSLGHKVHREIVVTNTESWHTAKEQKRTAVLIRRLDVRSNSFWYLPTNDQIIFSKI